MKNKTAKKAIPANINLLHSDSTDKNHTYNVYFNKQS